MTKGTIQEIFENLLHFFLLGNQKNCTYNKNEREGNYLRRYDKQR